MHFTCPACVFRGFYNDFWIKTFLIKDSTKKHIPDADICNDPDMDYSYFTKSHRISMTQLVQEFSRRICEILCPVNAEVLLNYVAG